MHDDQPQPLTAFALNCSLKASTSDTPSSTEKMIDDLFRALKPHGVSGSAERVIDHPVKPGVMSDMGRDDGWPSLRARIIEADIFILATPIWLGHPSSPAQRVLERLDAFLGEADDRQRMPGLGKVALVAVVGNEDGAHAVHAACFQALSDCGFSIPGNGGLYWVGEAMQSRNYVDLDDIPEPVAQSMTLAASNTAHLARRLKARPYPGVVAQEGKI
ncbi:MAG: NAD(P)H-dependent oxidoreductase [Proteobacteria bacterium]|nr:NAD(P)H-dependent oxidoreductase [Pseudomonadota bacterium]